jgi:hypothetical protein
MNHKQKHEKQNRYCAEKNILPAILAALADLWEFLLVYWHATCFGYDCRNKYWEVLFREHFE